MEKTLQDLLTLPKKLNLKSLKQEIWGWIIIGVVLSFIAQFFDKSVFVWLEQFHSPALDAFSLALTERFLYAALFLFVVLTGWRVWRNPNHHSKLLPGAFAIATATISGIVLKQFFGIPRPFFQFDNLDPLVWAEFASFPSGHTAVAFALLVPIYRISKFLGVSWFVLALIIGFARIYQNVHFPSDIAAGIFLGGVIGAIFSNPNTEILLRKWWKKLEFRRQSFHFLAGFLCVFAHWVGLLRWRALLVVLVVGLLVSAISARRKIPIISNLLSLFDRKRDEKFPGRGAFYFLAGILISIVIFPVKIAYASILILAVGDSVNHLFFARSPKQINLPWNRKKNLYGLFAGIVAGTFAAQFFVPFFPAFIATSVAILLETVIVRIGKFYVDDNIMVPVVAGTMLVLLGS